MKRLLPEICHIQYGFAFDSKCFSDSKGTPLIRIRDVVRGYSETYTTEECGEEYHVFDGDLLIGMDGEFNIAKWNGGKAYLNQRVCKLTPSEEIDAEYLYYFMPKALKAIEDKTPFVTVKHLSAKQLNAVEVPLPDLEEQQKISVSLSRVDRLIALRKQQLEKLDELVKARFVELFDDSNYPSEPLDNNVIEMFIGPFGSSLKNEVFVEEKDGFCMVYEQKHAIQKTMNVPTRYVPKSKYEDLKRFTILGGDIIVSCRGTIGEVYTVPDDAPMGIMHPSIMKIRLDTQKYNQKFFVFALEQYMDEHSAEAKGSGVKMAVSATVLGQSDFVVPPMEVQNQFAAFVEQTDKSKLAIQKSLEQLETLKKGLMQQYFG